MKKIYNHETKQEIMKNNRNSINFRNYNKKSLDLNKNSQCKYALVNTEVINKSKRDVFYVLTMYFSSHEKLLQR